MRSTLAVLLLGIRFAFTMLPQMRACFDLRLI